MCSRRAIVIRQVNGSGLTGRRIRHLLGFLACTVIPGECSKSPMFDGSSGQGRAKGFLCRAAEVNILVTHNRAV